MGGKNISIFYCLLSRRCVASCFRAFKFEDLCLQLEKSRMNLSEIGSTPIPGSSPAGQEARYDTAYEQLQAEIDKLTSVTQAGEVDWGHVVDLAADIIENKSKDFLAAAYMSVGLMHVQDFEGLSMGSRVLNSMVATFWDDGYPPKMRLRGRMNVFSWWEEKVLAWLKTRPGNEPVPPAECAEAAANIKKLDGALGELLPDLPPMRELVSILDTLSEKQREKEEASIAHQAASPGEGENKTTQPETSTSSTTGVAEDASSARKMLSESALTFAAMGRAENPADPWAWKASRMSAWINVKGLPPAQGGQTMIPAPDSSVKPSLLACLSDGKLLEAATRAEDHFAGAIFWLDLQRIIANAFEGLGEDFAAALEVVRAETKMLLDRLKGLDQLSFSDSTPFADAETRAWIASLNSKGRSKAPEDCGDDAASEVLDKANSRFLKKDVAGALDLISRAIREAPDGSMRLRLRLGQVDLLCRCEHFGMASALAEELLDELGARGLESWDPSLAVRILLSGRDAFIGEGGEDNLGKARRLAARISRIRPSAALNLTM
jgi:type VI secretion system protein VasJ